MIINHPGQLGKTHYRGYKSAVFYIIQPQLMFNVSYSIQE